MFAEMQCKGLPPPKISGRDISFEVQGTLPDDMYVDFPSMQRYPCICDEAARNRPCKLTLLTAPVVSSLSAAMVVSPSITPLTSGSDCWRTG